MHSQEVVRELERFARQEKAEVYRRFFKTGPGDYGEGDEFIGVTMPEIRSIAKPYAALDFIEVEKLLASSVHEIRMTGLLILVYRYKKAGSKSDVGEQKEIYDFFLAHREAINNWDLVDVTVPHIMGDYLLSREKFILYELARSPNLWERRIAILATLPSIKKGDFVDILKLSELLLSDSHDLMHKAVGWMLREVGKKDRAVLERFLTKHVSSMPRTMLRYAIEKFPESERKAWLNR